MSITEHVSNKICSINKIATIKFNFLSAAPPIDVEVPIGISLHSGLKILYNKIYIIYIKRHFISYRTITINIFY